MIDVKQEFIQRVQNYESELQINKWFFSDLRDDIIKHISPQQAHTSINDLAPLIVQETDNYLYHELLLLTMDLTRHAETAQMPSKLEQNWNKIQEKSYKLNKPIINITKEIARWYRIHV